MIGDLDSTLLFPEAFAILVLAKSYHVAKSAIVPTVVRSDDELVEANSRLSFLSGVMGFAAAVPGIAVERRRWAARACCCWRPWCSRWRRCSA